MLAEQLLDLRDAGARPVLDPRLRKVVLDVMKATIVHTVMIDQEPLGSMGRAAHLERRDGLLIVNPSLGPRAPRRRRSGPRGRGARDRRARPSGRRGRRRARPRRGAVALGMAGGDGSLGARRRGRARARPALRLRPVRDAKPLRAGHRARPRRPAGGAGSLRLRPRAPDRRRARRRQDLPEQRVVRHLRAPRPAPRGRTGDGATRSPACARSGSPQATVIRSR